jgi:hypothetical protein
MGLGAIKPSLLGSENKRNISRADDADGADTKNHSSAVTSLARADESWLRRLITRRVPLEQWSEAALDTPDQCTVILPQQCLYFLPDPQGHGSLRPTFSVGRR